MSPRPAAPTARAMAAARPRSTATRPASRQPAMLSATMAPPASPRGLAPATRPPAAPASAAARTSRRLPPVALAAAAEDTGDAAGGMRADAGKRLHQGIGRMRVVDYDQRQAIVAAKPVHAAGDGLQPPEHPGDPRAFHAFGMQHAGNRQ